MKVRKGFGILFGALLILCMGGCGLNSKTAETELEPETRIGVVVDSDTLNEAAETVRSLLDGWTEREVILADGDFSGDKVVLSITGSEGQNEEEESLRAEDYYIKMSEGMVYVRGGNQNALERAVKEIGKTYLAGWTEENLFTGELETVWYRGAYYTYRSLEIGGYGIWEYSIVAGEDTENAEYLQNLISEACAYDIPIISANELTDETPAIVFGSSHAGETDNLSAGLASGEGCLKIGDGRVYFCSGDAEDETIVLKLFITEYLKYVYQTGKAKENAVELNDEVTMKFTLNFDGTDGFLASVNKLAKVPTQEDWQVQQGGCSDGTYAYYILVNQLSLTESGKMVKFDMSDWSVVAVSDRLETDHSNDMTYIPETNQIVVVHNKPNYSTLSIVDPETLTEVDTVDIGRNIYSIAYCAQKEQYVCGASGTSGTYHILDKDFKLVKTVVGPETGYTTQGIFCDENYIYAIQSGDTNYIFVLDWEGNRMTQIEAYTNIEAENLYKVGDLWYTAYYSSGGLVYETIIYKVID